MTLPLPCLPRVFNVSIVDLSLYRNVTVTYQFCVFVEILYSVVLIKLNLKIVFVRSLIRQADVKQRQTPKERR